MSPINSPFPWFTISELPSLGLRMSTLPDSTTKKSMSPCPTFSTVCPSAYFSHTATCDSVSISFCSSFGNARRSMEGCGSFCSFLSAIATSLRGHSRLRWGKAGKRPSPRSIGRLRRGESAAGQIRRHRRSMRCPALTTLNNGHFAPGAFQVAVRTWCFCRRGRGGSRRRAFGRCRRAWG